MIELCVQFSYCGNVVRLDKLELGQYSGVAEDKRLQTEITKLLTDLRDLDSKYNEKVQALNLSLNSLSRYLTF